jgi:hypothetical protein
VGVSFTSGYPDNLHALAMSQTMAEEHGEPLVVVLKRNPDNAFDSNAVEVHVPSLGEYGMIGHLNRHVAARFAPLMDAGTRFAASVEWVRIHPDHPDRPGISISVWPAADDG